MLFFPLLILYFCILGDFWSIPKDTFFFCNNSLTFPYCTSIVESLLLNLNLQFFYKLFIIPFFFSYSSEILTISSEKRNTHDYPDIYRYYQSIVLFDLLSSRLLFTTSKTFIVPIFVTR